MKNQIKTLAKLIVISILVFSCSNDNDETNDLTQILNPPSWIIGTWQQTGTGTQGYSTEFEFTNTNVKYSVDGDVLYDFGMYGNNAVGGHNYVQEEIDITSSVYEIRRTHRYNGNIMEDWSWKWIKESNTSLRHELSLPTDPNANPQVKFYEKE